MKAEDAEEYTQALGQVVAGGWRQIALGQRLGVPNALGLATQEWVEQRLGGYIKLSVEQRRGVVKELAEEGHSQRQIGAVLGVTEATVNRDLRPVTNVTPEVLIDYQNVTNVTPDSSPLDILTGLVANEDLRGQAAKVKLREARQRDIPTGVPVMPAGQYATIVIDPPWPIEKIERRVAPNQIDFDYPTMTVDGIKAFGDIIPAADNCHLFMWITQKYLPAGFSILESWGFNYVFTMVWHKNGGFQPFNLAQYNCEFVLYGRRGSPVFTDLKNFPTCFSAARREHSRKPDEFYDIVRRVCDGPRIDIFSREQRNGFNQYGNEVAKFRQSTDDIYKGSQSAILSG